MATLTFLRIGKEIHDDLEDFLADHLIAKQQKGWAKIRYRLKKTRRRAFIYLLRQFGVAKIL